MNPPFWFPLGSMLAPLAPKLERQMSDFADDVQRYLTPEQQAAKVLFGYEDYPVWCRDGAIFHLDGEYVSYNQVVERFRKADPGPAGFGDPANWATPDPVMPDLTRHRLVYLGSPYTKYAAGLEQAFRDVAAIAAEMLQEGVKVYSPIAHTHPLAIYGNLDPRNHEIWLPFDQAMMDAADAMVIADMDGWRDSYGVQYEIDCFRKAGKPVYFRSASGEVSHFAG